MSLEHWTFALAYFAAIIAAAELLSALTERGGKS